MHTFIRWHSWAESSSFCSSSASTHT